jgi:hypothetical protein
VTIALLMLLLGAGMLFGWRANITFEPNPIKYIPVPVRDTLSWDMNSWTANR